MSGINLAFIGAALLVVVLFARKSAAAAAPAPAPSQPVDTGVKPGQLFEFPPGSLLKLGGSTISGTPNDPVHINDSVLTNSAFESGSINAPTVFVTNSGTGSSNQPVPLNCMGARTSNLGQCLGPGGNPCDRRYCQ